MKTKLALCFVCACAAAAIGCESSPDVIVIGVPALAVPAGAEVQNCYYMKAPNLAAAELGRIVVDFAPGTHHAHIYYGAEDRADGVEECFNAVDFDKWHLLVAAGREQLDWQLPDGVALQLRPRQQLLVQIHYVNVGKLTTDGNVGGGTFTMKPRPAGEVREHMAAIFGQQRNIHIPPQSSFAVEGLCRLPRAVNLAAFAGHYHFRGKDFIGYRTGLDGIAKDQFYRTDDFAEPVFSTFGSANPMPFGIDQQIMWHCDYQNDTGQEIDFGPREADQEHCNLFAFYYPAQGEQEFTPCVSWDRCAKPCTEGQRCNEAGTCVAR